MLGGSGSLGHGYIKRQRTKHPGVPKFSLPCHLGQNIPIQSSGHGRIIDLFRGSQNCSSGFMYAQFSGYIQRVLQDIHLTLQRRRNIHTGIGHDHEPPIYRGLKHTHMTQNTGRMRNTGLLVQNGLEQSCGRHQSFHDQLSLTLAEQPHGFGHGLLVIGNVNCLKPGNIKTALIGDTLCLLHVTNKYWFGHATFICLHPGAKDKPFRGSGNSNLGHDTISHKI